MRALSQFFPSLLGILAACATYPPPHAHLATATAIAQVADELGAERLPWAALYVQLAREEIVKAQALLRVGQNEQADYMTLRAYHDAELAIALIHEATVRLRYEAAREQVRSVGGAPP